MTTSSGRNDGLAIEDDRRPTEQELFALAHFRSALRQFLTFSGICGG